MSPRRNCGYPTVRRQMVPGRCCLVRITRTMPLVVSILAACNHLFIICHGRAASPGNRDISTYSPMASQSPRMARNYAQARKDTALPPIRAFLGAELALPLPHLRDHLDDVGMDLAPVDMRETEISRHSRVFTQYSHTAPQKSPILTSTIAHCSPPSAHSHKSASRLLSAVPSSCPPSYAYNILRPSPAGELITSVSTWRPRSSSIQQLVSQKRKTGPSTNAGPKVRSDGKRAHVCSVCQKRFNRPSGLRTHKNVHTGLRPFTCTYPGCTKVFSVASNMRRHHIRTHNCGDADSDGEPQVDDLAHEGFYEWAAAYKGP